MLSYTLIYYYVPEDGESQTELNTYGVPQSRESITLKDIKATFPLKGKYTFRFLTKHGKNSIFIDLLSENDNVPMIDKKVTVKANRISWTEREPGQSPKAHLPVSSDAKSEDRFDFEF